VTVYHPRKAQAAAVVAVRKTKLSDLFAPFRDRTAVVTLFFVSIPVQLAFFGLFQYTLPIVMDQAGLSEANIGRILTIYGIISLGAPFLARYADRTRNEKRLLVMGNIVTGAFLMVFFAQSGVWAIVLVVAAIGIGGLVFDTVTSSYLSFTKASEKYGETRFLSVFLTWEKFFTVFIPVLVGSLMTVVGYVRSAAVLGVVIALGAIVFAVFSRSNRPASPGRAEGEKS
jgi:predicted MFS family arabinose efflux permease